MINQNRNLFGVIVVGLLVLTGCGGPSDSSGDHKSLVIGDLGGSYSSCQKTSIVEPWEKESGNTVKFGSPPYDTGAWKAQSSAGELEWDVTTVDSAQLTELISLDLLAPLGKNIDDVDVIDFPDVRYADSVIASELFANVISYRTDKFQGAPETWADVFNLEKFPGKRMFSKNAVDFGVLEIALLADGVASSKLYPLDVERALAKLDTIKNEIVWYESGAQMITLISQGDAVIGAGYDGRLKNVRDVDDAPVDFTYDEALLRPDYWSIPVGDNSEVELARDFIHFAMKPEQQAAWAECSGYTPIAAGAFELLDEDFELSVDPENPTDGVTVVDFEYWLEHRQEVADRFNDWLLSG